VGLPSIDGDVRSANLLSSAEIVAKRSLYLLVHLTSMIGNRLAAVPGLRRYSTIHLAAVHSASLLMTKKR